MAQNFVPHIKGRTQVKVSGKRVLRKIFGPQRGKQQCAEANCIIQCFIVCTSEQILLGQSNERG